MCSPCPQAELVRVYAEVELAAHTGGGGGGGGGTGGNKDVETGSGVTGRGGEEGKGRFGQKGYYLKEHLKRNRMAQNSAS